MTLKAWLQQAYQDFQSKGFSQPRAETELLASQTLGWARATLVTRDTENLSPEQQSALGDGLGRRLIGEPLAYIVGFKNFYKSQFAVGPGVLIPRPETELVVELALGLRNKLPAKSRISDFGAGTGCIGISTILEWPEASLVAVENSPEALKYLKQNIAALNVSNRAEVREIPVESLQESKFHVIVANPPYIAVDDEDVELQVRKYEPGPALFSDDFGYGAIKRWLKVAVLTLHAGGFLIMEIGATQGQEVRKQKIDGLEFQEIIKDLAGHDRVLIWRKS